jgi:predicted SprT family Zn-dependent metalloprotease
MLLLEQLDLAFEKCSRPALSGRLVARRHGDRAPRLQQDVDLELKAHELLCALGASRIAADVRVEWNSRLKTCAGRANYRTKVISLNPRLHEHPTEIERTLRHELAHFLAQFRTGRRRMLPHGEEWRAACRDLGIGDEKRCHNLPFPVRERARRFLYRCPSCARDFPRVRKIRRAIACLACCRAKSRGKFDARFRLQFVASASSRCPIGKMPMPR